MKIVRMKIGFWLIPDITWTKNIKTIYLLWWHFIFKWDSNTILEKFKNK